MSRVVLVHWNAEEAAQRAGSLRRAGWDVDVFATAGEAAALRSLAESAPAAFVIGLARMPSHGRDVALWLRQRKATRAVPIVFVGGTREKVEGVRELLPDATYSDWRRLSGDLRRAIESPPSEPVVPGNVMAGYSGTPLPKKLGIKAGKTVALVGAPEGFEATLGALPEDVRVKRQARGPADVILLFAASQAEMRRRFPAAERALAEGGGLWIAWPKKASGVATDLTQADVRSFGLGNGMVDYKICAVDETWSGLLFARRKS